jgi:Uma2 family endonuclease
MPPKDSAAGRIKLGWDEFLELPEDGNRYEILDGELVMTPPPAIRHQRISSSLHFLLYQHVSVHGLGEVLAAPVAVRLSESTIAEPDLVFLATGRSDIVGELSIDGAPDLLVEILSPATAKRDRTVKAQLYARLGVRHYWIVDPEARTVDVFELEGKRYRKAATFAEQDSFEPAVLPGLTVDLSAIWA